MYVLLVVVAVGVGGGRTVSCPVLVLLLVSPPKTCSTTQRTVLVSCT